MAATSTIDQHAVNRAKQVERLVPLARRLGWNARCVAHVQYARDQIAEQSNESHISDTTWACLVIRLGGDL
jgi:hypothetical protein